MCGFSGVLPSYMACTASTYGADSLTKRWPAPLTRTQPGRLRSARQKYGPPGSVHQPGGRAEVQPGPDPVAGVPRRAGRPFGPDRSALVPAAHLLVALEA